jgi:PAS domain S-box-containing protein/putative nucleotidyltransferase with HDIG domain
VRSIWEADLLRAIEGGPGFVVSSPELQLLRSDGRRLWMVGRLTVVNDDILAQWIDLTEIRRAEAELRANEQRFRGMIEHNLAAICVVMGMEVVYCNRRLSDLTGWRVDELVGADVTVVFRPDPEGFEQIKQARERLKDGAPAIELTLACHIKDGRKLLIGVHGSMGVWDGQPATVLTIQDVTERQQAEEKIAAYVQQLEGAVQSTLTAVAKMLDMRDPYTAGHERRVGLIAADIAKEMGWDEARCYALNLAGLVHDIGKIAVPAEILTKPTRLTTLEYEMVKTHAELGYEILKDVDFLRPVATVIRSHHERLDGSGYPLGLKGDQIPVEARVLAVADVLESMASHRPYRASLGIEAALRELEGHRDLWFDREVVDALLRLVRDRGYQLPD